MRVALVAVAVFCVFGWFAGSADAVFAGGVDLGLEKTTSLGLTTTDIRTVIGRVINYFFGLLGLLAVGIMLYAGFLWMTAGGNEEQIQTAKKWMLNGTIGLVIIMSSYAFVAFLLRAVSDDLGGGGGVGGGNAPVLGRSGRGLGVLGRDAIEYHYPESGQADVPRNTKISITFKKPLVLSSVIKNYNDNNTVATNDDYICTPDCATEGHGKIIVPAEDCVAKTTLAACTQVAGCSWDANVELCSPPPMQLNFANMKIVPQADLQAPEGGTIDARFDARYSKTEAQVTSATVKVTRIADPVKSNQTMVIAPSINMGSPTEGVNYRVAMRGGSSGVRMWTDCKTPGVIESCTTFDADVDGGFFWPFATGTALDTTPPKLLAAIPFPVASPGEKQLMRNQMLQLTFDEPVDPTTAAGITGTAPGGGFNNIEIQAKCRSPLPSGQTCDFGRFCADDATKMCRTNADCGTGKTCNATPSASYVAIDGELKSGNKLRTIEFLPSAPCEGVMSNSCGEPVYCLPKNVDLRMVVKAASVDPNDPPQSIADNGVLDLVGNSFDGNGNGLGDGPVTTGNPNTYSLNIEPNNLAGISDTASAEYVVGNEIDLEPPSVVSIEPSAEANTLYAEGKKGPSQVPVTVPIKIVWDKFMSTTAMVGGVYDDEGGVAGGTVAIRAKELKKSNDAPCKPATNSTSDPCSNPDPLIEQPSVGPYGELDPAPKASTHSIMYVNHPPFLSASDLGYTEEDEEAYGGGFPYYPVYQPVLSWRLKDLTQNCFYPSRYAGCTGDDTAKSCCNKLKLDEYNCPLL